MLPGEAAAAMSRALAQTLTVTLVFRLSRRLRVDLNRAGETVSVNATHRPQPARRPNRCCINLVCVAGLKPALA